MGLGTSAIFPPLTRVRSSIKSAGSFSPAPIQYTLFDRKDRQTNRPVSLASSTPNLSQMSLWVCLYFVCFSIPRPALLGTETYRGPIQLVLQLPCARIQICGQRSARNSCHVCFDVNISTSAVLAVLFSH